MTSFDSRLQRAVGEFNGANSHIRVGDLNIGGKPYTIET